MKKIALFSLMCCLGMLNAYGANQCKVSREFKAGNNNWNAGSDEYLFENERDYMNAVNTGWYYECDYDNCPDNSYVEVKSEHVFEGKTIHSPAKYKCSLNWSNDKWEKVDDVKGLTKCTEKIRWNSDWGVDKLLQNAEADEYLFPTVEDYYALKSTNYVDVYECDSSACTDGQIITLPAGHFFQRKKINKQRKYKCILGQGLGLGLVGDDRWDDITDDCEEDCDNNLNPVKKQCTSTLDGKKFDIGQSDTFDCNKYPGVDPNRQPYLTGKVCYRTCLEKTNGDVEILQSIKECIDNTYTHIDFSSSERARYKTTIPGFKKCEKKSEPVKPGFCDKYKQWDKRYACCLAGKDTEWKGKDLSNDGTCVCKDGSKWEYNEKTKRGKCVANGTPVPPATEGNCTYSFSATIECKGVTKPVNKTRVLTKDELGANTCEKFKELYGADLKKAEELFGDLCNDNAESETPVVTPVPAGSGPSDAEISSAQSTLKGFFDSAKSNASVWRTSEGNFNGARLASDITAGVVLGTVGGVVSGVVIKKNQVKKGFEALHCTVGGQKVAEWGDEFSVGLRR